jgi:hypothetical protein
MTTRVDIKSAGHYVKVTVIEGGNRTEQPPTNADHHHYVWAGRSLLIEEVPAPEAQEPEAQEPGAQEPEEQQPGAQEPAG